MGEIPLLSPPTAGLEHAHLPNPAGTTLFNQDTREQRSASPKASAHTAPPPQIASRQQRTWARRADGNTL